MSLLDVGQVLISLLLFSTVVLMVWALFAQPAPMLAPAGRQVAAALGISRQPTVFDWPVLGHLLSLLTNMARRFPYFRQRIWQDLEASGNPNGYTVEEYLALCLASGVGLGIASAGTLGLMGQFDLLTVIIMPIVGFFVPLWSLREAAARRVREIAQQLPYTLDLISLLLEAGANFSEAVRTVVRDEPDQPLNQELQLVQAEMSLGTSRARALTRLGERIPLESLRSVIGAINQAEALGTPMAKILKTQAGMIRMLRSVKAEEASASASLRILLPSMLILMAVVLVVFSPIILMWIQGRLM